MNEDQISELITINTAAIKAMQEKVNDLSTYAERILSSDSNGVEISIEEMPSNGNELVVKPLYDPRSYPKAMSGRYLPTEAMEGAVQIGYVKMFSDLDNIPDTINAFGVSTSNRIALGVIDVLLKGLKEDIVKLRSENSKYIKKSS